MITMTKRRWAGGIIGAIAVSLAITIPQMLNPTTATAQEKVQTWLDAWIESQVTRNVDAILACETEDCVVCIVNPNTGEEIILITCSRAERKLHYGGWKWIDKAEYSNINSTEVILTDTTSTIIVTVHVNYWHHGIIQSSELTYIVNLIKMDGQWLISAWRCESGETTFLPQS